MIWFNQSNALYYRASSHRVECSRDKKRWAPSAYSHRGFFEAVKTGLLLIPQDQHESLENK